MTTVVAVASGPSFTEAQAALIREAREAEKCRVIVVNRSWERVPNADVLYGADGKWWRRYWPEVERGFQGECWTCDATVASEFGLCWIKAENCKGRGLSRDPSRIFNGGNSGYQALGLAYHFGATRIVLVGYDMAHTGGRAHWHDDYTDKSVDGRRVTWNNASGVDKWVKGFGPMAADLKAAGVAVVNCTVETALTQFPRADLAETLAAL